MQARLCNLPGNAEKDGKVVTLVDRAPDGEHWIVQVNESKVTRRVTAQNLAALNGPSDELPPDSDAAAVRAARASKVAAAEASLTQVLNSSGS